MPVVYLDEARRGAAISEVLTAAALIGEEVGGAGVPLRGARHDGHSTRSVPGFGAAARRSSHAGSSQVSSCRTTARTMQLLAACQKAPTVRRVVLESTTAVYGASPLDPALFDETMTPNDLRPPGTPATPPRSRATCAVSPGGGRTSPPLCCASRAWSARGSTRWSRATSRSRWSPPSWAMTPACSCCTRKTPSPSSNARWRATRRVWSTWPRTACSCSRRPSAGPDGCRCRCRHPPSGWSGGRSPRPGSRRSPRSSCACSIRPGRRHHPAAHRVRFHAALDDGPGLRRLRARPRVPPAGRARAGGGGGTAGRPRGARRRAAGRRAREAGMTADGPDDPRAPDADGAQVIPLHAGDPAPARPARRAAAAVPNPAGRPAGPVPRRSPRTRPASPPRYRAPRRASASRHPVRRHRPHVGRDRRRASGGRAAGRSGREPARRPNPRPGGRARSSTGEGPSTGEARRPCPTPASSRPGGRPPWRTRSRSCAAGSPASTRSTSSASTPT